MKTIRGAVVGDLNKIIGDGKMIRIRTDICSNERKDCGGLGMQWSPANAH